MLKLYDIAKKISGALVYVTYAVLLGATLFTVISVIMRYAFKSPLLGSVEIIEIAMSAMVFASLAFTQTEKGHIHITMFIRILPRKLGLALFGLCGVITTLASGAAAYACLLQGMYAGSVDLVTMMTSIPYAPFYYFASLCMLLLTVVFLLDTIISFCAVFNDSYAELVCGNW